MTKKRAQVESFEDIFSGLMETGLNEDGYVVLIMHDGGWPEETVRSILQSMFRIRERFF